MEYGKRRSYTVKFKATILKKIKKTMGTLVKLLEKHRYVLLFIYFCSLAFTVYIKRYLLIIVEAISDLELHYTIIYFVSYSQLLSLFLTFMFHFYAQLLGEERGHDSFLNYLYAIQNDIEEKIKIDV